MNIISVVQQCCCCSHINSHNQVRGHRTGSSHSGAGNYPRENTNKQRWYTHIIKIKIHSSCEIEYFVETHLCKLCVILRLRVLRVVCPH